MRLFVFAYTGYTTPMVYGKNKKTVCQYWLQLKAGSGDAHWRASWGGRLQ